MACESLEQSLADLKRQETDQQDLIKGLTGHPLEAAKARLAVIEGEIATTSDGPGGLPRRQPSRHRPGEHRRLRRHGRGGDGRDAAAVVQPDRVHRHG